MNHKQLETALGLAIPYGGAYTEDTSPALVIQGVPSLAGAGCINIAVALVSATGITVTFDYGAGLTTPITADQAGFEVAGSNNTLTFATYTTLGAFVDAINGTKMLRAFLVGGIRATASVSILLAISVVTCSTDTGLVCPFDGSSKTLGIAVSGERFINNGKNGWKRDSINYDAVLNGLIYATFSCTYTTISTSSIQVYYSTQAADTLVYTTPFAASTVAKTLQAASADLVQLFAQAPIGSRVVVQVVAAAGTTFTSVQTFTFVGKSAVLSGARLVTSMPY